MFWNKIRKLIFLSGLSQKKDYLSLNKLSQKIKELEEKYNLKLDNIKSFLESQLRNSVSHENSRFEMPNIIVFLGVDGTEIMRLTTEEICERLIFSTVAISALKSIENTLLITSLEPLLKLSDEQLKWYCKTGILTQEMLNKINEKP